MRGSNEKNMTEKTKRILAKMRRPAVLEEFNCSTLADVGPVGGDQKIKILSEMNEMQDFEHGNLSRDTV
jgi:hypothetical protein